MDIDNFIQNFADIFDDTPASALTPETSFRDLDEWSSLSVLGIIAMCDQTYDKELSLEELHRVNTIQELFDLLTAK